MKLNKVFTCMNILEFIIFTNYANCTMFEHIYPNNFEGIERRVYTNDDLSNSRRAFKFKLEKSICLSKEKAFYQTRNEK